MKIIYRANDGKEFSNEKDCRAYENRNKPKMWDCGGDTTDDFDCAKYLYFENEEQIESFLRSQGVQDKDFDDFMGISINTEGLYIWDECNDEYDWICLGELADTLQILRQANEDDYNKLF